MQLELTSHASIASSIGVARSLLNDAHLAAATAVRDSARADARQLAVGSNDAMEASSILLMEASGPGREQLRTASEHAYQGASALNLSSLALQQELPADIAAAQARQHALVAVDAFERAFDILDRF